MKVSTIGDVAFTKMIPGCEAHACAEVAKLKNGKLAIRFTETDSSDVVLATEKEVRDIVEAAKAGKLDHYLA